MMNFGTFSNSSLFVHLAASLDFPFPNLAMPRSCNALGCRLKQPPSVPVNAQARAICLVESVWAGGSEDLLAALVWSTVRQREAEVLGGELLDVWAADVIGLLDLDDLEDLERGG